MTSRPFVVRGLLIVGVVALSLCLTDACSCFPASRKTKHCNAEFSFIGYPYPAGFLNIGNTLHRRYCFWINHVFKPRFPQWLPGNCVYTPVQAATCGITFQQGRPYIVNGDIRNGRMHVNACGWNEEWWRVPRRIKQGMRSRFWCSSPENLTIRSG